MKLSVIIPAKNEERFLPETLHALRVQSFPSDQFEVIVVDNGSRDRTVDVARESGAQVLEHPEITVGALRNRGAGVARGEILAFLDADCIAATDWLESIAASVQEERCVTGCEPLIDVNDSWVARAWFCLQPTAREKVRCIGSANLAVPKDVFQAVGGFDETLTTGEDCELCARAATRVPVIADPRIKVIHRGTPQTVEQFLRREMWHGLGALGTVRHNLFDKPFLGTIAFFVCTLIQSVGLIAGFVTGDWGAFMVGTGGIIGLLGASVYYRRRFVRDKEHAFQLGVVYWWFYLGRAVALVLAMNKRGRYHENRS